MDDVKVCARCHSALSLTEFNKWAKAADGLKPYCRACDRAYQKQWREKNQGKRAEYSWKALYGITREQYEYMLETQDGLCAICREVDPSGKPLAVDHNSVTKEVRGLLCGRCNPGIGFFLHDVNRLQAAIDYLVKIAHWEM